MHDGSRCFGDVPSRAGVDDLPALRAAVAHWPGALETGCVSDAVVEAWLEWEADGHAFACNLQDGDWWCFVEDPRAPADLLQRVLDHLAAALDDEAGRS
ncbi:MAG: hypothetical protein JNK15_22465 [Planctomycetes bacterium]|nr:hypothetical protein [Planctomycetota bacterium]